jgi:hypothetical protein
LQEPYPNTKNGFLGSNEKIIPEYFQETKHFLVEGDELLLLFDQKGSPKGKYKLDSEGLWIKQ